MKKKPILFVQAGPFHLFWVTGIYYLWELKDKYNFIIIANEEYNKSEKFKKILKYLDVEYIYYQKQNKGFRLVFDLLKEYKKILINFKPRKFLIYNNSFIDNQCLIYLIRSIGYPIEIFQFQNGKIPLDLQMDRLYLVALEAVELQNKYKFLKNFNKISFKLAKIKKLLIYFYYFKLIPFFLLGVTFKPDLNIFNGVYKKKKKEKNLISKYFVYLDIEANSVRQSGISNCKIIDHPLKNTHKELNEIIYGKISNKNQMVILPTIGFLETLMMKGYTKDYLIKFISDQYIEFLRKFKKKFPNYQVIFKLHPSSKDKKVWMDIVSLISQQVKVININPSVNAEKLIIQSKIIISDVSTVLWWTIFFDKKIAISLDIFNFDKGDEMLKYGSYLYYIKNLKQIEKINFKFNRSSNCKFSVKKYL